MTPITSLLAVLCLVVGVITARTLRRRMLAAPPPSTSRAWTRLALVALLAAFTLSLVTITYFARVRALAMVFPTRSLAARTPEQYGLLDFQEIEFEASDGLRLFGWYFPSHNGAVIILIHGHGGNRAHLLEEAAFLSQAGFGLLLYDARNHGASQGSFSTFGLLEANDVVGAVDFIQSQAAGNSPPIGVLGISMGAATAILATEQIPQVQALVAEAAYASLDGLVRGNLYNLARLPAWPFAPLFIFFGEQATGAQIGAVNPAAAIANINPRPVLLIHGELDQTVPVSHAHQLLAAARPPKDLLLLPTTGHGGYLQTGGEAYVEAVVGFFHRYLVDSRYR